MKLLFKFADFTRLKGFKADLINVLPLPNGSFDNRFIASANPRKKYLLFNASEDQIFNDSKKATLLLTITDTNDEEGNMLHKKQKNQWTFADGSETFEINIKLKGKKAKKIKQSLLPKGLVLAGDLSENSDLEKISPTPTPEPAPAPVSVHENIIPSGRPTIEAQNLYSAALAEGPSKRYGGDSRDRYNQSLEMERLGRNKPKLNPVHHYLFDESISTEWREQYEEWMKIMISVFGGYDNWVHAMYDINETGNTSVLAGLESLGYFYDNDGNSVEPSIDFVHDRKSCLSGFAANAIWDTASENWSFCNQPNPFTDPHWEYDREVHFGETGFKFSTLNGYAHEYYHHVQRAHDLAAGTIFGNSEDMVKAPTWYIEGTAQIVPMWLLRDYFDDLTISKELGLTYEQFVEDAKLRNSVGGGAGWPDISFGLMKQALLGVADSNSYLADCDYADSREENYETSVGCDVHIMASYLMYITSPQIALVDIMEDQWTLGFEGSFAKHVGLSLDQFYVEFNNFMKQGKVETGVPSEWEGSPNMLPPKNFFLTPETLSEAVDFWSIDSGLPDNNASKRQLPAASSSLFQSDPIVNSFFPFDEIIADEPITKVKGTKHSDNFDIESGLGYKVIRKFDPSQDQITFCGCPATKLDSYSGDTYISKGFDLKAIVKGVEADELMITGNKIVGTEGLILSSGIL